METFVEIIYGDGKSPLRSVVTGAVILVALMLFPAILMGMLFAVYTQIAATAFSVSYIFFTGVSMVWYYNTIRTLPPYTMHFIMCFGKKTRYYVKDGKWPEFPPFITFMKGEDSVKLGPQIGETEEFYPTTLDGKKYKVKIKYTYSIMEQDAYKFTKAHKDTFEKILAAGLVDDTRTLIAANKHEDTNSILRSRVGEFKNEVYKLKDYKQLTGTYGCVLNQFEFITWELQDEEDKDADAEVTRARSHQNAEMEKIIATNAQLQALRVANPGKTEQEIQDLWELAMGKKTKTEIHNSGSGGGINLLNIDSKK